MQNTILNDTYIVNTNKVDRRITPLLGQIEADKSDVKFLLSQSYNKLTMIFSGNELLGFLLWGMWNDTVHIHMLSIKYQKRGIGKHLLSYLGSITTGDLMVTALDSSREFYIRSGFRQIADDPLELIYDR